MLSPCLEFAGASDTQFPFPFDLNLVPPTPTCSELSSLFGEECLFPECFDNSPVKEGYGNENVFNSPNSTIGVLNRGSSVSTHANLELPHSLNFDKSISIGTELREEVSFRPVPCLETNSVCAIEDSNETSNNNFLDIELPFTRRHSDCPELQSVVDFQKDLDAERKFRPKSRKASLQIIRLRDGRLLNKNFVRKKSPVRLGARLGRGGFGNVEVGANYG